MSEQACPLRSADRALIWRPMPRKRLIKAGRWEGGRALSRRVKASQLPGLIGRGASGKLLGRDWVTWWLSFSAVTRCTFTHSLPWVCCSSKNSALWCAKPPQICPTRGEPGEPDVIFFFFWKRKTKEGRGLQMLGVEGLIELHKRGQWIPPWTADTNALFTWTGTSPHDKPGISARNCPATTQHEEHNIALSSFLFGSWGYFPQLSKVFLFFLAYQILAQKEVSLAQKPSLNKTIPHW